VRVEEDHIVSIKKFFVEKLQELYMLKDRNKDLGWK
jgi:hypothetical protein